jgi:hypothetical protein
MPESEVRACLARNQLSLDTATFLEGDVEWRTLRQLPAFQEQFPRNLPTKPTSLPPSDFRAPQDNPAIQAGYWLASAPPGGWANPVGWGIIVLALFRLYPVLMCSIVGLLVAIGAGYEYFREKPAPPPSTLVATGKALPLTIEFRNARQSRHGFVIQVTNTSTDVRLGTVWARRESGDWQEQRELWPGAQIELGWLELKQALLPGDRVTVWIEGYDPLTITVVDPAREKERKELERIRALSRAYYGPPTSTTASSQKKSP